MDIPPSKNPPRIRLKWPRESILSKPKLNSRNKSRSTESSGHRRSERIKSRRKNCWIWQKKHGNGRKSRRG